MDASPRAVYGPHRNFQAAQPRRGNVEIRLDGKAAFITGGSKGIGLAIASQFAASGADVAIVARGREALDAAAKQIGSNSGGRVVPISADVSRADEIARAYDEAMRALGRIDILV